MTTLQSILTSLAEREFNPMAALGEFEKQREDMMFAYDLGSVLAGIKAKHNQDQKIIVKLVAVALVLNERFKTSCQLSEHAADAVYVETEKRILEILESET